MQAGAVGGYGLWSLALVNAVVFTAFAIGMFKPRSRRDWRTLGSLSAFFVALFAEMYGFPLTLYLLWSWLGGSVPGLDPLSHEAGHIWPVLLGLQGDPHFSAFHLLSTVFLGGGFWVIAAGWRTLYAASQQGVLATGGPYRRLRHPQYLGFMLIMVGFLLQWPTLLTLAMLPLLTVRYLRLAREEEQVMLETFGDAYREYAARVPAFVPKLRASYGQVHNMGPGTGSDP